jgi:hypothetical protein
MSVLRCKCGAWQLQEGDLCFNTADGKTTHTLDACSTTGREGIKYDSAKEPWELLPWEQVRDIVKVLQYGAIKYAPNNWKDVKNPVSRYFAAAMRHLTARLRGEVNDPESGLPHLAHAGCCLLFMAWVDKEHHAGT